MNLLNLTDEQYIALMTDLKPIDCKVHDKVMTLSIETIQATRLKGIHLELGYLKEIHNGAEPFSDEYGIDRVTVGAFNSIEKYLNGGYDHYFTSIQRAVHIQTQQSVPMFCEAN